MSALRVGVIVIGRNEGRRLVRSLESLRQSTIAPDIVVYVDSGSEDGSPEAAAAFGAAVVRLSNERAFCAARARNAGFARLKELEPDIEFVQFLDGDCVLASGWLSQALDDILPREDVAIVCGQRRESRPEASIYNRMCDIEWNTTPGAISRCGGDFLIRAAAFRQVAGFNAALMAHEEPEMCIRLRALGWRIWRLPVDMTLHDADMSTLGQWWRRTRRSGYGYSQVAFAHRKSRGAADEVRALASASFWSGAAPTIAVLAWTIDPAFLFLGALYPAQVVRLARAQGRLDRMAWIHGSFMLLAKFAEFSGLLHFVAKRLRAPGEVKFDYKGANKTRA